MSKMTIYTYLFTLSFCAKSSHITILLSPTLPDSMNKTRSNLVRHQEYFLIFGLTLKITRWKMSKMTIFTYLLTLSFCTKSSHITILLSPTLPDIMNKTRRNLVRHQEHFLIFGLTLKITRWKTSKMAICTYLLTLSLCTNSWDVAILLSPTLVHVMSNTKCDFDWEQEYFLNLG